MDFDSKSQESPNVSPKYLFLVLVGYSLLAQDIHISVSEVLLVVEIGELSVDRVDGALNERS